MEHNWWLLGGALDDFAEASAPVPSSPALPSAAGAAAGALDGFTAAGAAAGAQRRSPSDARATPGDARAFIQPTGEHQSAAPATHITAAQRHWWVAIGWWQLVGGSLLVTIGG